jgi:hypothetical protein
LRSDLDLDNWYTGATSELFHFCLPGRINAVLTTEHWDWFLAIIYFLPEFLAAILGGLFAAWLFRVRKTKVVDTSPTAPAVRAHDMV